MANHGTRLWIRLIAAGALAGLFGLACQAQATRPPPEAAGLAATGDRASAREMIHLRELNKTFSPTAITVTAGSNVRLVIENQDPLDHNLFVPTDIGLKLSEHPANRTTEVDWFVSGRPGTYRAISGYYPYMDMTITVIE